METASEPVKRLIVLGAGGRLGAALARSFSSEYEVVGFNRGQLDLGSPKAVADALEPACFDALINCAALTNVDYCETHEEEAMRINAHAVGQLASICARKKARLIHIGTDYVFDGHKATPYTEEDPANPISVYGQSKRQGEIAMLEANPKALGVRVSWVFGPDRPSFIDAILKRARESGQVEAIADKFSAPTSSLDMAQWLSPLLLNWEATGILHLCNHGECSWRDYGEFAIRCAIEEGIAMKTDCVAPLKIADMTAFVAKRPVYTVLSTDRFTRQTGIIPRTWQEAVQDYVKNQCPFLRSPNASCS